MICPETKEPDGSQGFWILYNQELYSCVVCEKCFKSIAEYDAHLVEPKGLTIDTFG